MPKCKCGNQYCNYHRYFTSHNCEYNYLENHKKKLEKTNIKIVNRSIEVI